MAAYKGKKGGPGNNTGFNKAAKKNINMRSESHGKRRIRLTDRRKGPRKT